MFEAWRSCCAIDLRIIGRHPNHDLKLPETFNPKSKLVLDALASAVVHALELNLRTPNAQHVQVTRLELLNPLEQSSDFVYKHAELPYEDARALTYWMSYFRTLGAPSCPTIISSVLLLSRSSQDPSPREDAVITCM